MELEPELFASAVDPAALPLPRRLSTDLRDLLAQAQEKAVTIAEIERLLQGRGFAIFILLLAAPFIVPAPGLSTPFGLAIALLGLRIALGQKPSLPSFILRREIKYSVLSAVVGRLVRVIERVEKHIKPRMRFLQEHPRMINLIGVGIVSGGFVLALPLPIPFSNAFPAISIMLLAAGMMERDGLLVLWGHLCGIASWFYLAVWWKVVEASIEHLFQWWHH